MSTPSAPVISNAPLASPNTLEYWWYPPVSGAPIQDYQLTLTSQYGTLNCNVGSPGTYYRVTGLSNATTYFTTIAASNANGLGIAASFREFQPGSPPPRGVSSLSAVAVSLSTGSALVSWTPPFGYPPVPDATIFWYAIYGYTTANAVTPVVKYTAGGLTQSNYFIPGLNSNSNYYFTVRAVNCPGWSVPLSTNTITFITTLPFAPNMLSGLQLWFDAQDNTSLVLSGTNVTTWNDKSGNLYNATGVNSPQYTTSQFVSFNGTNQYFTLPNNALPSGNSAYSYFGIVNFTTSNRYSGVIGGGTYGTDNATLALRSDPNNSFVTYWWNNDVITTNKISYNTPLYINSLYDGAGNRQVWLSFSTVTTATGAVARAQTTGNNTIGTTNNATEFMAGRIYELVTYSNQVTPFQRQKVEGYLAWKWGLQTQLPTTHPFYTAKPMSNSVFAPPMLSSLQLWLDASDTTTVTLSSGRVTSWADKSGNGYNATTRINGSNIVYGTQLNGLSTLFFNSTAIAGVFSPPYTGSNVYSFFVGYFNSTANGYNRVLAMGSNGVSDANNALYTNAFTRNNNTTQIITERAGLTATTVPGGVTTPFFATAYSIPGSRGINANGGAITSNASASTAFYLSNYVIGGPTATAITENFIGNMGEILVYTRELSTQDRQTVEGYLAWKWGLQGNLPTTHPYRYNNPSIVQFNYPSPTSYGGLQLWLDASQLTGLSNGGSLTTWTDRTSNAYVGTALSNPTFVTNSLNGLPIVRFNGSTQYVNFGNVINVGTNGGLAIFAVAKYANGNPGSIVAKSIYGGEVGRWALWRNANATPQIDFLIANSSNSGTVYDAVYNDSNTSTRLHSATWDRRNLYLYSNATLCNTVAGVDTGNMSNSRALYVGAYGNGTGSGPQSSGPNLMFNGDMAEVLVYTANVTPFIRQQIEGYLSWKWGLQGSLPSSHPYFTAPPQQAYTTFTPTVYSGLRLWLDASDTTTLTGATSVSQWADKSGNGNNVSQAVTAQQPVRYTTTNGLTGLSYTASVGGTTETGGQWFRGTFATPITNNRLSIFVVASMNSATQNYGRPVSLSALTQNDYITGQGGAWIARNSNTNAIFMAGNGAEASEPGGPVTLGTPFIVDSIFDGTTQTAIINGTQVGTKTFTANFNIIRSGIGFLSYQGVNTNTDRWDGTINEVLVYNNGLDTSGRQTVEGYLAWKWGLQGNLPIAHPYKFMNPAINYTTSIINPNGLLVNFAAATYSGSGTWFNYGALGSTADATVENGTTSKNVAGNGVVFNGSNNYTFPNISLGNAWSASVWVKQTGSNQPSACYLTQNVGSGVTNLSIFTNDSGASPPVGVNQVAGGFYTGTAWKIPTPYTLTSNVWVNLTYTWDGTTVTSYINGTSNALTTGGTASNSGQAYRIGRMWTGSNFIVGEIGQILIYNRPLSAADVLQNYAATSNAYTV